MSVELLNCIPVHNGSLAEKFAINFGMILEEEGYKPICYRTGKGIKWSYDLYVIPKDAVRTTRQNKLDSSAYHVISLRCGYFVSSLDNYFVHEIDGFLVNAFNRSAKEPLLSPSNL